jgi:hypothetical protein
MLARLQGCEALENTARAIGNNGVIVRVTALAGFYVWLVLFHFIGTLANAHYDIDFIYFECHKNRSCSVR